MPIAEAIKAKFLDVIAKQKREQHATNITSPNPILAFKIIYLLS